MWARIHMRMGSNTAGCCSLQPLLLLLLLSAKPFDGLTYLLLLLLLLLQRCLPCWPLRTPAWGDRPFAGSSKGAPLLAAIIRGCGVQEDAEAAGVVQDEDRCHQVAQRVVAQVAAHIPTTIRCRLCVQVAFQFAM